MSALRNFASFESFATTRRGAGDARRTNKTPPHTFWMMGLITFDVQVRRFPVTPRGQRAVANNTVVGRKVSNTLAGTVSGCKVSDLKMYSYYGFPSASQLLSSDYKLYSYPVAVPLRSRS